VDLPGLPPPLEKTNSVARLALKGASSGVSTNSAVASAAKGTAADLNDDGDDEKPPAIDATLTETEHILVDYVAALRKLNLTTAGRPTE
jgi:hypothetical protein